MSESGAPREWHPLLTVRNLLIVLTTVAGATFGLFTWDMERGLTQLNSLASDSNTTAASVQVLVNRVQTVEHDENQIASEVTDHEKRITILETTETVSERQHRLRSMPN